LLDGVRQFVREQMIAGWSTGLEASHAEVDV
jgi:hypothetical protein